MAHEVESMAFRDTAKPWHGLGNALPSGQSIEQWQQAAGMDWELLESPVMYAVGTASGITFKTNPESKVLFRSDSQAALSVVSQRYQPVQPREILEFYRDLVSVGGFELETAGSLKGGRKLWALAKTGQATVLKGGDKLGCYLLLATSCDGSLSTQAFFTSVRVVCNNTLQLAVTGKTAAVSVRHSTTFDAAAVKQQLGLGMSGWDQFQRSIKDLSSRAVSPAEAKAYLVTVLGDPRLPEADQPKPFKVALDLFSGSGKGSGLASAKGTAWGLLNSVTQFIDHDRQARSPDNRLDSAWFGSGAAIKGKAFEEALHLL